MAPYSSYTSLPSLLVYPNPFQLPGLFHYPPFFRISLNSFISSFLFISISSLSPSFLFIFLFLQALFLRGQIGTALWPILRRVSFSPKIRSFYEVGASADLFFFFAGRFHFLFLTSAVPNGPKRIKCIYSLLPYARCIDFLCLAS